MQRWFRKFTTVVILFSFLFTSSGYSSAQTNGSPAWTPQSGLVIPVTAPYRPAVIKGIQVDVRNPFRLDFILEQGDLGEGKTAADRETDLRAESLRLIKYFLVSLTVPQTDLWVNLSPYEKDRITSEIFGQTEMGKDLLVLDYELKQVMASLLHPDNSVGKQFWREVYARAFEKYGTTDIPLDTFNKVWITTDRARIYETPQTSSQGQPTISALVVDEHLKVMLESDYLAMKKQVCKEPGCSESVKEDSELSAAQELAQNMIREVVIPVLEKEVNEGERFSRVRQMYHSLVLATWYKRKLLHSLLTEIYADRNKIGGVEHGEAALQEKVWTAYVDTFRKGIYSLIREEEDPQSGEWIPRKYFSGGAVLRGDFAQAAVLPDAQAFQSGDYVQVTVDLAQSSGRSKEMTESLETGAFFEDVYLPLIKRLRKPVSQQVLKVVYELGEAYQANNIPQVFSILDRLALIPEYKTKGQERRFRSNVRDLMRVLATKVSLRSVFEPGVLRQFEALPGETREYVMHALEINDPSFLQTALSHYFETSTGEDGELLASTEKVYDLLGRLFENCTKLPIGRFVNIADFRLEQVFAADVKKQKTYSLLIRKHLLMNDIASLRSVMGEIQVQSQAEPWQAVAKRVESLLAKYGYDDELQPGAASDIAPETSDIPVDIAINIATENLSNWLSVANAGNGKVLSSIVDYLEGLQRSRDYEKILKGIPKEILDGISNIRRSFLDQLSRNKRGQPVATADLIKELVRGENVRLLGFDVAEVGVLKAFQSFMEGNTNATYTRIKRFWQNAPEYRHLDLPTRGQVEAKVRKLNALLVQHVYLELMDEETARSRETEALQREFSRTRLEQQVRDNLSWSYDDLIAVMMAESGADRNAVIAYLTDMGFSRKEFANKEGRPMETADPLAPMGYPIHYATALGSKAYVDQNRVKNFMPVATTHVTNILKGLAKKNQSVPRVLRVHYGSDAIYVRVSGVLVTNVLAGLTRPEIQGLKQAIIDRGWGAFLGGRGNELVLFKDSDADVDDYLDRILADKNDQTRERIRSIFNEVRTRRKVIVVAWNVASQFKTTHNDERMDPVFEEYLKRVGGDEEPASRKIPSDQAMQVQNPGGIDLNPDGMNLEVRGTEILQSDCSRAGDRCASFKFSAQQIAEFRQNLTGFDPVIVRVTHHIDVPSVLGF